MLIHHLKFANVKCENLYTLYLSSNSIDDEGVIALTECLPELFPCLDSIDVSQQLRGVSLHGNPVSEELVLMCNEHLKVLTL